MRWLARGIAALVLCACGGTASRPSPGGPSVAPVATTSLAKADDAPPAKTSCKKRSANQSLLRDQILDGLRQPETGAYKTQNTELFRYLPLLHESGMVTSIAATHTKIANEPVFALTMLVRNAKGEMDAHLGFAAAPCPDGELALLGPLVPLGFPSGTIDYVTQIPYSASALTELRLELGEPIPPGLGRPPSPPKTRSFAVGMTHNEMGIVGAFDLDLDLPPEEGIHRRDVHLFGTGWYVHRGGVSFLLTHHITYDTTDLCTAKRKARPASPPQLRLLAHIDPRGFTTDASLVGAGYIVAIGENQPPPRMSDDTSFTLRSGPTVVADAYFDRGPPAQWFVGLFDSAEDAKARMQALKYATGTIYATSPKEPSTVKAKRTGELGPFACDVY